VVIAVQIALGGWVSSNYAALACPDLPGCMGRVFPPMDFGNAFHVFRELGRTGDGELLPLAALTAIHWTHRMFALLAFAVVGVTTLKVLRTRGDGTGVAYLKGAGAAVLSLLVLQLSLGVASVALGLPLPLAAAHNAGAALLLACLVVLNFFVFCGVRRGGHSSS
jgi:cytochrome c oxidase assembly protein subunit 15